MKSATQRKPTAKYIIFCSLFWISFAEMFLQSASFNYFFYLVNTDMRKGFDSLSGIVTEQMQFNPLSRDVYVFINRRRTQMKLLQWEGDGFALYYKRLEQGTYELPASSQGSNCIAVTTAQMKNIFEGITMRRSYKRKRYQHKQDNC